MDVASQTLHAYRAAIDHIFSGVIITDADGVVIGYNKAASDLEGIDVSYAMGRSVSELYFGMSLDIEHKSKFLICMETARPIVNIMSDYITFSGSVKRIAQSYYPIVVDGKVLGSFCIINKVNRIENVLLEINTILERSESELSHVMDTNFSGIIGQSAAIQQTILEAKHVAHTDIDALIIGETGTGKELFTQTIHKNSSRKDEPFVPINCATIPENLLESILFGTTKGAFTDSRDTKGLFEHARGGTLFLDELNSMGMSCQVKLLRAIQEKKIRKLGAEHETPISCRIIAALNEDPLVCIKENTIRQDLFYRLSIACISISPLCERKDDIPVLVEHFIAKNNTKYKKRVVGISAELLQLFMKYDWKGNTRELMNVLEGMFVFMDDETWLSVANLSKYHLQQITCSANEDIKNSEKVHLQDALSHFEKKLLTEMLMKHKNNKSLAAKELGVSPQNLYYKLKKFGIQ